MSKWARINPEINESHQVLEIITYNPEEVINEAFWPLFKPCPNEVYLGYWYNPQTEQFFLPEGYAKHPDFEKFGYIPTDGNQVDQNGFVIFPKNISLEDFRSRLSLSEKILWDNPETGTSIQTSTINTVKNEFPLISNKSETLEIFELLETNSVIGTGKAQQIYDYFNN